MNSLADAVASPASADNKPLPYGRSHWDGKPAELHAMILKAAGPLTLFVNGLLGDKDSLDEATVEALWTDAINIDWQGDLALLPDIDFRVGGFEESERPSLDMLSLPVTRSMYGRLCTRFPEQAVCDGQDAQDNQYQADIDPELYSIESTRLRHIPFHNGWFDLIDFSYPISLGWIAIYYGHAALLSHLAEHHNVDLGRFQSNGRRMAMDMAVLSGSLDIVRMLHEAGNTSCSDYAMDWAASNGRLDMVIWLHENREEGCTVWAMDRAAREGHLDVVRWLHENREEGCTTQAMDDAARNGHLEVVQFLLACGYRFTFDALIRETSDDMVDVLVASMPLARAAEMLQMARSLDSFPSLVTRLERAVADNQA